MSYLTYRVGLVSGYFISDSIIAGFSHLHLSGTGICIIS